jgi:predicted XRE-type DNA-binding protein
MSNKKSARRNHEVAVEMGSGNVYADLGVPDSEDMLVKAQLVRQIAEILRERRLTQAGAAKVLRLTQPKISRMLRGEFRGISERRLLRCLTRLGRDVQIVVKETREKSAEGRLTVHFG